MPRLKMRGLTLEEMKSISSELLTELVSITEVSKEHFTMEHIDSSIVFEDGNRCPFVEVSWFKRSEEKMQRAVDVITKMIRSLGYEDVTVYFDDLIKNQYFKNGNHY